MLRVFKALIPLFSFCIFIFLGWNLYCQQSDWPEVSSRVLCAGNLAPTRSLTCEGLALQSRGYGKAAIEKYLLAAEPAKGTTPDSYAQYLIAVAFKEGTAGLTISNDTAKQWLGKSAESGNVLALSILHVFGIPALLIWALYFALLQAWLIYGSVPLALRQPMPVRKFDVDSSYLMSAGITALLFGALAKQSFFTGADFIVDMQLSLIAAACIGSAVVVQFQKRAASAEAIQALLDKRVSANLSPEELSAIDKELASFAGSQTGHATYLQKLWAAIQAPELIGIRAVRKKP